MCSYDSFTTHARLILSCKSKNNFYSFSSKSIAWRKCKNTVLFTIFSCEISSRCQQILPAAVDGPRHVYCKVINLKSKHRQYLTLTSPSHPVSRCEYSICKMLQKQTRKNLVKISHRQLSLVTLRWHLAESRLKGY